MAVKVMCPVCKSEFMTNDGTFGTPVTAEQNGIAYLVPKTVGKVTDKTDDRIKILKEAGIDVTKLQTLMQSNAELKDIFNTDDPIIDELSKGGFIRNPELFRRWITAQTFALLKDSRGWTAAVRHRYNTQYVYRMTMRELNTQIKLQRKGITKDRRYTFFTLDDFKAIFIDLAELNSWRGNREGIIEAAKRATSLSDLEQRLRIHNWAFSYRMTYIPRRWLNCFKGAGAYYTLQNIIRTHGLVLPNCKDMNESLNYVENIYNKVLSYSESQRRWDILLSVLTSAVKETKFELKY